MGLKSAESGVSRKAKLKSSSTELLTINQSKLKLWRMCQKAYAFRYDYEEGKELVPKHPKITLKRGTWMHELQRAHHESWAGVPGAHWVKRHDELTQEFYNLFEEERAIYGNLPDECERMFRAYLRYWKNDTEEYTPYILDDGTPAIEWVFEIQLPQYGIRFKGTIDLLVADNEYGGLWIWDSKWVSRVPPADERMMSPQSLLYVWALRSLGFDIRGFVYNYGRTKAPAIPRVLKSGMLSVAQNMDTDYWTYLQTIRDNHGDQWREYAKHVYYDKLQALRARNSDWFRRERIPCEESRTKSAVVEMIVSKRDIDRRNKRHPPRSYSYNCKFRCDYHDICVAEFTGMDIEPLVHHGYTTTDERYGRDSTSDEQE